MYVCIYIYIHAMSTMPSAGCDAARTGSPPRRRPERVSGSQGAETEAPKGPKLRTCAQLVLVQWRSTYMPWRPVVDATRKNVRPHTSLRVHEEIGELDVETGARPGTSRELVVDARLGVFKWSGGRDKIMCLYGLVDS